MGPDLVVVRCGRKLCAPAPAGDLYVGSYHRAYRRAAAALAPRRTLIHRARYELVDLDQVLAPYDTTFGDWDAVTGAHVAAQADQLSLRHAPGVVVRAGRRYIAAFRLAWPHALDPLTEAADTANSARSEYGRSASKVGLAESTPAELVGEADRCFLKHYCVPLAGRDRRPDLPRCRPSRALADGFNDDLPVLVARLRSAVDTAGTPSLRVAAIRRAARRLLLAVATIESVSHATWSTDRETGAALLAEHHPEWTGVARRAVAWSAGGGTSAGAVDLFRLGEWLVRHP